MGADKNKLSKIRRVQREIKQILFEDWDPIGIKEFTNARDEYDSYVAGVYRLVAAGAGAHPIAQHLLQIEKDRMSLSGQPLLVLERVAQKLAALHVNL